MNREERFHQSVNVLATAYREGTLRSASCQACAVGNLCADALGLKMASGRWGGLDWIDGDGNYYEDSGNWLHVVMNHRRYEAIGSLPGSTVRDGHRQIAVTGYTVGELDLMEKAFEDTCAAERRKLGIEDHCEDTDAVEYAGLVAVYEVLCKIHDVPVVDQVEPNVLFFKDEKPEYQVDMVKIEV